MENTFDFYSLHIYANTKTEFKKAGVSTKGLERERIGYKRYGYKVFPIYRYKATVGFVDATDPDREKKIKEVEALWKGKGLQFHVKYHVRD
jgi:hypothetical protein